jgi:hypothetical protein
LVPQDPGLFDGELEHEVLGEALQVSLDRADQHLGLDLVEAGDVSIQDDLLSAEDDDDALDDLRGDQRLYLLHGRALRAHLEVTICDLKRPKSPRRPGMGQGCRGTECRLAPI